MIFIINIIGDVEDIFIEESKSYFFEEVRFEKLYPNFGNLRISGTHPLAFLVDQQINNAKLPTGLFPSVTIIDDTDQKSPNIPVMTPLKDIVIKSAEVADMELNRDKYAISDEDLNALKDLTANSKELYAQGVQTYRMANMVVEIWSENPKVKNKIYDLVNGFLIGIKRFTIKEKYNIVINEDSITGEKSGNYNYDFGMILYGAIMRFTADFAVSQYYIDTENQGKISGVLHTYKEVVENE